MILTRDVIIKEIEAGRIRIDPLDIDNIGPASIDLTLGDRIRTFVREVSSVKVTASTDHKKITKPTRIKDSYHIKPGELVLGITEEKITLPDDICGWLNTRSRFARLGLMVHVTAPFIQPGISNRQVLEIFNAAPYRLELVPGEKLCQFVFERCEGRAKYHGMFKAQRL